MGEIKHEKNERLQKLIQSHTHGGLCSPNEIVYKDAIVKEIAIEASKVFSYNLLDYVYESIKHGDDEHQKWLKDKIEEVKREIF